MSEKIKAFEVWLMPDELEYIRQRVENSYYNPISDQDAVEHYLYTLLLDDIDASENSSKKF